MQEERALGREEIVEGQTGCRGALVVSFGDQIGGDGEDIVFWGR